MRVKTPRTFVAALVGLVFTTISLFPGRAQAEMPAKVKALLIVAAYGTAGGALLGTASMAFGAKPRAVAVGASLGLYAGIIFGSYIVLSHSYAQDQVNPDVPTSEFDPESEQVERWNPYEAFSEQRALDNMKRDRSFQAPPAVYLNLIQFQF